MLGARRLSGSLPFSIAVHLVVLLALFIIPLVANVVAPDFPRVVPPYMVAVAIPDPVVPRAAPVTQVARTVNPDAAPIEAPTGIVPEIPRSRPIVPDLPLGDAPAAA